MKVETLIRDIRDRGGDLALDGEAVVIRFKDPLPDELVGEARQHKTEIASYLRSYEAAHPDIASACEGERVDSVAGGRVSDCGVSPGDAEPGPVDRGPEAPQTGVAATPARESAASPAPPDLTREDRCQEALPESAKARRWEVTLTTGHCLLHSSPSGLTRQEAIELSKDWGEVAECVPCPPAEIREPQKSVGDTLIEACEGTSLGPDTFRALLDDDDLADIAEGLIPPRTLQAYAESFAKRLPPPPTDALVCCADCVHFERIDRPHIGRCAQGHGRHYLWDTDRRRCNDFDEKRTSEEKSYERCD
jgi:hypothetical protein